MEKLLILSEQDNYVQLTSLISIDNLVNLSEKEVTGIQQLEVLDLVGKNYLTPKSLKEAKQLINNKDYTLFKSSFSDYIKCNSLPEYFVVLVDHLPRAVRILKVSVGIPTSEVPKLLKYLETNEGLQFMHKQLQSRLSNL